MAADKFFNEEQKNEIVAAIVSAETGTSAEIRVHIDSMCLGNPLNAAIREFARLDMTKTKDRNGVLIYIAYKSKKCAILGDEGINNVVTPEFWDECYHIMVDNFRNGDFSKGIALAVAKAGDKLKEFFPYQSDDTNELPDDISFGK